MNYLRHAAWYLGECGLLVLAAYVCFSALRYRVGMDLWHPTVAAVALGSVLLLFRRVDRLVNDTIARAQSRS